MRLNSFILASLSSAAMLVASHACSQDMPSVEAVKEFIKKEKLGLYFDLLVNDNLNEYLHNIDTIVMEKVQKLIKELTEKENITEELKDSNQMLWVSKMNNKKNILFIIQY